MAKLTKPQIKAHQQACTYLSKKVLSYEEREFVINNWQESASHINSAAGAFFTPLEMAWTFAVEVNCDPPWSVIDLCAGIGCLSFATYHRTSYGGRQPRIVCVEKNPEYVKVGRKVLPEAEWICADVFELPDLGRFTFAISNPPYGSGGPNRGVTLDLNVVAVGARMAEFGAFILPQASAPFKYSGQCNYEPTPGLAYAKLREKTGIQLGPNCGIDCDQWRSDWRGVAPRVEIVTGEFLDWQATEAVAARPAQAELIPDVPPLRQHSLFDGLEDAA